MRSIIIMVVNHCRKYDDGRIDFDPHGMHIAGILAGNDTRKISRTLNGIDGIAPNAQIFL